MMLQIRGKLVPSASRSTLIRRLSADTLYLICVLALGTWPGQAAAETVQFRQWRRPNDTDTDAGEAAVEILSDSMLPFLVDSLTAKCTEVRTPQAPETLSGGLGGAPDRPADIRTILTRRLGLIIGCCMGFVVFVVLVSVLGYLKVKKRRHSVKRDQPAPPEYLSYRHFSIQSGEAAPQGAHPQFITAMGTTAT